MRFIFFIPFHVLYALRSVAKPLLRYSALAIFIFFWIFVFFTGKQVTADLKVALGLGAVMFYAKARYYDALLRMMAPPGFRLPA
jgi:hypothetical protein